MTRAPLAVARTEVRRTIRTTTTERTKLLLLSILALVFLGTVVVGGSYLMTELGEQFADGVSADRATATTAVVTGLAAVGWLFLVFMTAIRTFTSVADPDEPAFLLVSTPLRNVVVGILGAEVVLFAIWVLPPALVLSGAFAVGAGTVLPVLAAAVVAVVLLVTAVPVGFVIGVWVRHLVTVYEPIARYRLVLFAAFWILYFGAIATGRFDQLMGRLFTGLQDGPLGWPGHLLLAGVPNVSPSSAAILGSLVGASALGAGAVAVAIASARVHWFADPARFEDEPETTDPDSSNRLASVLGGFGRPVRTVAITAIRRTKRAPIRLAYVGYPLLGAIGFVQGIVQSGTVPSHVAVLLSLYVVWGAGALFTLNPLGDLGRALPAVLTSTLTGRQAVGGLVVAGTLVAAPVGLLVSLGLGLVSPLSLEQTAALTAGTVVGTVVTPALATGVGSAFPRFGSVKVTNNREAVMPSKTAFVVYSVVILLPAGAAALLYADAAGTVATLIAAVSASAWVPGPELALSAGAIAAAAWAVLVVGLLAPPVSALFAAERFDWYTLE